MDVISLRFIRFIVAINNKVKATVLASILLYALNRFLSIPLRRQHNLALESQPKSTWAFSSLLYSDEFLSGVRTLGASIVASGTVYDRVVIVTNHVSWTSMEMLKNDGWRVKVSQTIENPGTAGWSSFSGSVESMSASKWFDVYTKLLVFNLTEYDRVIFLDADTVVIQNIDDMFLCDGFCAVLRHSEKFNTGVLSVAPSQTLFENLMSNLSTLKSYDGSDQGFLNAYFHGMKDAPMFSPADGQILSSLCGKSQAIEHGFSVHLGRLETIYNADVGLYLSNNHRWPFPAESIRILHYTLGGIKPWKWWSVFVLGDVGRLWSHYHSKVTGNTSAQSSALYNYLLIGSVLCIGIFLSSGKLTKKINKCSKSFKDLFSIPAVVQVIQQVRRLRLSFFSPIMFVFMGSLSFMVSLKICLVLIPGNASYFQGICNSVILFSILFPLVNEIVVCQLVMLRDKAALDYVDGQVVSRNLLSLILLKFILYCVVSISIIALICTYDNLGIHSLVLKLLFGIIASGWILILSFCIFYTIGCLSLLQRYV